MVEFVDHPIVLLRLCVLANKSASRGVRWNKQAIKRRVSDPRFRKLYLLLCSYDYNIRVEGLLPAKLCLVATYFIKLVMFAVLKIPPHNTFKW